MGNKSKMMAIFDKDSAGGEAFQEIKNNNLYFNPKVSVKVMQLELSSYIEQSYIYLLRLNSFYLHKYGKRLLRKSMLRQEQRLSY